MPEVSAKKQQRKKQQERYLRIPNHILNLTGLRLLDKVLLAHFYSFGHRGCWQSNATLAEIFMKSSCTITRSIAVLKKAGLIAIKSPKGCYRTIWTNSHPEVRAAHRLHASKTAQQVKQNGTIESSNTAIRVTQECSATNNMTITENYKDTTATPPPWPAGGQASALLVDRSAERRARLAAFKRRFGMPTVPRVSLSPQDFEQRRQKQKQALLAGKLLSEKYSSAI